MIPQGDDHRIRRALKYMTPEKVLQWARITISPGVNERDIRRLHRSMCGRRTIGTSAYAQAGPITPHSSLIDDGTLGKRIDGYIRKLAKLNHCSPAEIGKAFGWR